VTADQGPLSQVATKHAQAIFDAGWRAGCEAAAEAIETDRLALPVSVYVHGFGALRSRDDCSWAMAQARDVARHVATRAVSESTDPIGEAVSDYHDVRTTLGDTS
jgi:hypothetical protein